MVYRLALVYKSQKLLYRLLSEIDIFLIARYLYRGVTYVSTDLYFKADVAGFSSARPLDESAGIVCLRPGEIDPAELSSDSARNALRRFMELERQS